MSDTFKENEMIVYLYEALEGSMPDKCSCSEDQLQDACACGYVLGKSTLDEVRPHYLKLLRG